MRRALKSFILVLSLLPFAGQAAPVVISPTNALTAEQGFRRSTAEQDARQTVEGRGDRMAITYTTTADLEVDLAPLRGEAAIDPVEEIHFTLPKGERQEAVIDLTASPGWSMFGQRYHLHFFAPTKDDRTEIIAIEFQGPSWESIGESVLRGLRHREQFVVSTPHAIRGASLAGIPLVVVLGLLTLAGAAGVLFVRSRGNDAITILLGGLLLSSALFARDLRHFTVSHTREWEIRGTIGQFGAAEQIGRQLREAEGALEPGQLVWVCTDAGNYFPKAVRYSAAPLPVSTQTADIERATAVLVAQKYRWRYDDNVLSCGPLAGSADMLAHFTDGSILFAPRAP